MVVFIDTHIPILTAAYQAREQPGDGAGFNGRWAGTDSNKKSFGLHCKNIRFSPSAVREFKLFFV
jgi:hypothetical protein